MKNINKNLIFFPVLSIIAFFGIAILNPNEVNASYVGWQNGHYVYCYNGDMNGCYNNGYNGNNNGYNNYNTNPIPYINSTNPNSLTLNGNTNTITIYGSNFITSSVVRFNNNERPTTYINSSTIQVQLNSYDLSVSGGFPITVYNPGPGGGMSNSITLNVISNINNNYNNNNNANTVSKVKKTTNTATVVKNTKDTKTDTTSSKDSKIDENSLAANAIFGAGSFIPSSFLQWIIAFILILLIVFLWRKIYVSDKDKSIPLKHA